MNVIQNLLKTTLACALILFLVTSCKKDATEGLIPDQNTGGVTNPTTSNFMQNSHSSGSFDSLCFQINYPITVLLPDGTDQMVNSDTELFDAIDAWYDNNPDSDEDPTLVFPIDVTLEDGSTLNILDEEQLEGLYDECFGEYDEEDCFSLVYPVTIVYPDGSTATANSEEELEMLFDDWETNNPNSDEEPTFSFPLDVTFLDGTIETLSDEGQLETLLEDCYYEDDFDICFELVYPVSVLFPDGSTQEVNSDEELDDLIFDWFENGDDSLGYPTFVFPVDVDIDGTIETVNSEEELEELMELCEGEWDEEGNPFEECFEISYPITVLYPDSTSVEVNSNEEFELAIDNWYDQNPDSDDDPTLVFPIELTLVEDGTVVSVQNEDELELIIEDCFECIIDDVNGLLTNGDQGTVTNMTIKKHPSVKKK